MQDQPELDAGWVRTQQRTGWHLLPVQVGPQASCSGYADRMSSDLATAKQQGSAEAATAVATARGLGIGPGSTLYYDLEDYDLAPDDCRRAALSFLSGWTEGPARRRLRLGRLLQHRRRDHLAGPGGPGGPDGSYTMPDDIWFAWANGRADIVTDERVLSDEWDDHARVHQYALDVTADLRRLHHDVDANWVDVGKGRSASPSPAAVPWRRRGPAAVPHAAHGLARTRGRAAQCVLRKQGL